MIHLLPSTSIPNLHRASPSLLHSRGGVGPTTTTTTTVHCSASVGQDRGKSLSTSTCDAAALIHKWEDKHRRELTRDEVFGLVQSLEDLGFYKLSLEVFEWMAAQKKRFSFRSSDAATFLLQIAQVKGISSAEEYFHSMPRGFKNKETYTALLTALARAKEKIKAERVMDTMKRNGHLSNNIVAYNMMMIMYASGFQDYSKAISVIQEVKRRGFKLDAPSFNILIMACAALGDVEEVHKAWRSYKSFVSKIPNTGIRSILSALIQLNDIEGAESIYQEWLSTKPKYDSGVCDILLSYYVRHEQLTKAMSCLEDIENLGGRPDSFTCELLATACIEKEDLEEASSLLKLAFISKVKNKGVWKPRPATIAKFRALWEKKKEAAAAAAAAAKEQNP